MIMYSLSHVDDLFVMFSSDFAYLNRGIPGVSSSQPSDVLIS